MNDIYDETPKYLPDKISSVVILLHGYGADGNDLLKPIKESWHSLFPETALFAPNGLIKRPAMGYEWFRLTNINEEEITTGVIETEKTIWALIAAIVKNLSLPHKKIFFLGFSQGTIVALHAGLKYPSLLGGVIGFSGALPDRANIKTSIKQKPPIVLLHGELDPVVPFMASEMASNALKDARVDVALHLEPDLAHAIGPIGFKIATNFLQKHLG
ncbi:MAG: alpha/beta hydrolase [Alphaproteobacteria bacterium]